MEHEEHYKTEKNLWSFTVPESDSRREELLTKRHLQSDEKSVHVDNRHLNEMSLKFSVGVKDRQEKLPTLHCLPKLYKRSYKARFIAIPSSCTSTELSKLSTACQSHVIRYSETVECMKGKEKYFRLYKIPATYLVN